VREQVERALDEGKDENLCVSGVRLHLCQPKERERGDGKKERKKERKKQTEEEDEREKTAKLASRGRHRGEEKTTSRQQFDETQTGRWRTQKHQANQKNTHPTP